MASGMMEFCEQVNPKVLLEMRRARPFPDMLRVQESWVAAAEKKALLWLAARTPPWISPDHLTLLGLAAQIGAGLGYVLAKWNKYALLAVIAFLTLNWLGDSLDGTLARVRQRLRPRYGFYVDHMVDTFGAIFLMAGLGASGYLHWQVSAALLTAFLALSIQSYLAAYTLGDFQLAHAWFGPTEIRILMMAGNVALLLFARVELFGREFFLLDIAGAIATVAMFGMAIAASIQNTRRLYNEERLP